MDNVVLFDDGEIELKVSFENETVWLNRLQMAELFGRDVKTIGKHINNVYKEKELDKNATVANFAIVQLEGAREVERNIEHYSLDVIISVGYRIKSQRGVRFRQWATSVLKQYISNGYTINSEKITHQRFKELEGDVALLKSKVNLLEDKNLTPSQGIFFDGQVFDAYEFIAGLIKNAKKEIVLIDNYIDESVLTLFSKNQDVDVTIYTKTITKQLKLDLQKYNAQYRLITIKSFKDAHDRFMIIDGTDVYHIGASLKDLGKKWFAFSKMELGSLEILGRLG